MTRHLPHFAEPGPAPAADCRRAAQVGRSARLELVFGCRGGRTILTHAYAEPPLRVGRCLGAGSSASVILVCCGPGVFAGDSLSLRVRVESGARVQMVSQSALQVHPRAGEGPAVIDARYEVEPGAALDCFWDPVIPFAHARLSQRIDLRVARKGRLFWSDGLMAGRVGLGEAWRFAEMGHELRLSVDASVAYLERFRLQPSSRRIEHPWIAGRSHYLSTTLVCDEQATPAAAEDLHRRLGQLDGVTAGVDCPAPDVLVSRLLATRGPDFAAARGLIRDVLGQPDPRRL